MGISALRLGRTAQIVGLDPCSLVIEEFDEFRNDLIERFFHQPVSGATDDNAFHIRRYEPALLDQEITRTLFPSQNKHWHRHRQGRLGKACEILRVLLERSKVLGAGAHAARPRCEGDQLSSRMADISAGQRTYLIVATRYDSNTSRFGKLNASFAMHDEDMQ